MEGYSVIKTIQNIKAYKLLQARNSLFLENIDQVYDRALHILPKINRVFANYTGHDTIHSLNVADYMFTICDCPEQLSDLELTVLIYSALLHDTGMVVSEEEINKIKEDRGNITPRKYSLVLEKYKDETIALQECIRPVHGQRSFDYIMAMEPHLFILPGYTKVHFQEDVAMICASHCVNFDWLTQRLSLDQQKGSWALNSQYIAMLLRIADYLDIDEERTPYYLYQYLSPKGYGDMEWRKHFVIENKEKVVTDVKTGNKSIEFYGESSNPDIHRKLLKYFDAINSELKSAIDHSERFREKKYLISVGTAVHNKIRPKGFTFADFKLSLDYNAVTSLLMGENIYGDRKYGLRELIQNSIDACMVMIEEAKTLEEFKYYTYQPFIKIVLDQDRKQVVIFDNGCGMSLDILKKYFLNVGVSYYVSDDYLFRGNTYTPIGNYGIGFLACFMLSDKVKVVTKYHGENKANKIEIEKCSEYICLTCEETDRSQGTEIILDYDQLMPVFNNSKAILESFIQINFLDSSIPIRLADSKDGENNEKVLELREFSAIYPEGINLSEYFDGINVVMQFNYRGIRFLKTFSDIYSNESLIYIEKMHAMVRDDTCSEPILLKGYIRNGVIKYLRVPIIPSSEKENFDKAYDVLDDFDEALGKIDYLEANILADDPSIYNDSELLERRDDWLIDGYALSDFISEMGHAALTPTYTYLEEKRVIESAGDRIVSYVTNIPFQGRYSFESTDYLYIKNVLISNAHLKIPVIAEGIELKGLVINVTSKKVIPNVSRNSISAVQNKELSYAVGKALHMWIYEHGNLDKEEKELILALIQQCYPAESDYLKGRIKSY